MRRVEENVIERFLACSDPQQGFARIYCDHCRHGFILAFSCKARYFCPSCHQKRVLAYGDWVEANVLAQVPHRQYVFTIPRLLRPMSARRRALLGKLCNIIERLLDRAYASTRPGARPGRLGSPRVRSMFAKPRACAPPGRRNRHGEGQPGQPAHDPLVPSTPVLTYHPVPDIA
jgi:transposase-like protein